MSAVVGRIKAIGAFLYDFVVGDDWRIAAGVVIALAITYGVSRTSAPTWWVMPAAVVVLLPYGLWRAVRQR
jgi:tryptophan-rich sensory protein